MPNNGQKANKSIGALALLLKGARALLLKGGPGPSS